MASVVESIDVKVPVSTAYNQWTQFETFPEFMEGVTSVVQTDDIHLHWVAEIGGADKEWNAEITEQHPDERVAWRSVDEPKQAGVVTFHRLSPDTTKVMVQMDFAPEGVVETAGDKLGVVKHRVKGDLERFKDFIEARGTESGGWRGEVR